MVKIKLMATLYTMQFGLHLAEHQEDSSMLQATVAAHGMYEDQVIMDDVTHAVDMDVAVTADGDVSAGMSCSDSETATFTPICNRFVDNQDALQHCIEACCADRNSCPDRDNRANMKVCTAAGDPHIKMFDDEAPNQRVYWPHGDYYLYSSSALNIQARYGNECKKGLEKCFKGKASVTGLTLNGPLLGPKGSDGQYPILEIPPLINGGKRGSNPVLLLDGNEIMTKAGCRFEPQNGQCTYVSHNQQWRANLGPRITVRNLFDVPVAQWRKHKTTLQIELFAGPVDGPVLHTANVSDSRVAIITVNMGVGKMDVMIKVGSVMINSDMVGQVGGQCGNGDGDEDTLCTECTDDWVCENCTDPCSNFTDKTHPTCGFGENHSKEGITPTNYTEIVTEFEEGICAGRFAELTLTEKQGWPLFKQSAPEIDGQGFNKIQQYLLKLAEDQFMESCTGSNTECVTGFQALQYRAKKYTATCELEHPGLGDDEDPAAACVIENCVTDCEQAGFCPADKDDDNWPGPPVNCPPPNTEGAFQACSFWGDPHFNEWFDPSREVNVDHYLHHRTGSRVDASAFGYNNFDLGLQRLFRTKDHHVEGQAFMCDARGDTTSTAAVAVRIGAKIVTFMRPARVGPDDTKGAWGPKDLSTPDWKQDAFNERWEMGMDLTINGDSIPYTDLGPNPGHSSKQTDEVGEYTKGSWFAQQLFIPEDHDSCKNGQTEKCGLWNPTCVGDRNRSVLIKASVPFTASIYEPIVTIELTQRLVEDLEEASPETPWLCMGPEHQDKKSLSRTGHDLSYAESLFTVAQLYDLCYRCAMLEGTGATNAMDLDGWVSSNGFQGCIHPDTSDKAVTGLEVCTSMGTYELSAATAACTPLFKTSEVDQPFWFDSCLAEFCNTDTDATGVHAEALDTASNIKWLMEIEEAEKNSVNDEFADDE